MTCRPSMKIAHFLALSLWGLLISGSPSPAVEFAILTEDNWDEFAPAGKEVDAIYGDYVLRNEKIVAVIGRDVDSRNANMTVQNVGGAIIDLTRREAPSDQLSAYYPVMNRLLRLVHVGALTDEDPASYELFTPDTLIARLAEGALQGPKVWLVLQSRAGEGDPDVELTYTLGDQDDGVLVETSYTNPNDDAMEIQIEDALRADGEFEMGVDEQLKLFWAYDAHWGQAYGVRPYGHGFHADENSLQRGRPILRYAVQGRVNPIPLEPGDENAVLLRRHIFPARDSIHLKALVVGSSPGSRISRLEGG